MWPEMHIINTAQGKFQSVLSFLRRVTVQRCSQAGIVISGWNLLLNNPCYFDHLPYFVKSTLEAYI